MVLAIRIGGKCSPCALRAAERHFSASTAANGRRRIAARRVASGHSGELQDVGDNETPVRFARGESSSPPTPDTPNSEIRERKAASAVRLRRSKTPQDREHGGVGIEPPSHILNKPDIQIPSLLKTKERDDLLFLHTSEERRNAVVREAGKSGAHRILFNRPRDSEGTDNTVRRPGFRPSFYQSALHKKQAIDVQELYSSVRHQIRLVRNKFARAYDPENTANAKLDETAGIQTEEKLNQMVDEFLVGLRRKLDAYAETHSSTLRETEPIEAPTREVGKKGKQAGEKSQEDFSVVEELKDAYFAGRLSGLRDKLQVLLIEHIHKAQMSEDLLNHQKACADMRYPLEWFSATRAMQRKIHLHVGPTNSGKTYHALQRLEAAQSGIYAGPLRLLAHEIYSRLNAKSRPCALITGEERRDPEGGLKAIMSSCTVEMVPLNQKVDVAVIDEIQMIADPQRGWAWTAAFLGVQAKEVHLCGELRTVPLVEKLCQLMGDELIIHRYERLTPLRVMGKSFNGKLKKLQKGDCIILFSRIAIHAMKKEVERATGKRCAVIYGSLPPETRAQQAALFNDPNNDYDFLVASDAVGMGLNLGIRRIIFESVVKYNGSGKTYKQLPVSEIKQIAGRAGRYRTAAQDIAGVAEEMDGPANSPQAWENVGLATTLDAADLPILRKAMEVEVEPITQAGLLPPAGIYKKFSAYFPRGTPFTYVLMRLNDIASVNPLFFACTLRDQMEIADAIEQYDLSVEDRLIMCASPANVRHDRAVLEAFTERIANQTSANLLEIPELHLEILDENSPGMDYLPQLEILHRAITLYLWLSYRFAGVFVSQPLAFHVKSLVEARIDDALAAVHWDSDKRKMQKAMRDKALREQMRRELDMAPEEVKKAPSPLSYAEEDDQEPLLEEIPGEGINIDVLEDGEVLLQTIDEEGLEIDEDGTLDKEEVIESLHNEDDQPRTQPTSDVGNLKEEEVLKMEEKEDSERAQPKSDAW